MVGYSWNKDKLIRAAVIVLAIATLMGIIGAIKSVYEKRRLPNLIKDAVFDHISEDEKFFESDGSDAKVEIFELSFDEEDKETATVLCFVGETEYRFLLVLDGDSWRVAEENRAE